MRWLTRFAILVYLALLSSPQTLAVNGSGVSRLADSQLQGLNPAVFSTLHQKDLIPADNDEPADASGDNSDIAVIAATPCSLPEALSVAVSSAGALWSTACNSAYPARAPPVFLSL
ncbi:hypothetical protein [Arsukibacterium sp.]|uniref:hypothetical protein n=1 Tax=Arsukibacterium sp. TaxID=1977258 RepID=UPI00299F46E5|nr:hypothetical protein [Arsukibacterium sp.]MDX1678027.1 hypothetical protein [Arsukibacterium sp.]